MKKSVGMTLPFSKLPTHLVSYPTILKVLFVSQPCYARRKAPIHLVRNYSSIDLRTMVPCPRGWKSYSRGTWVAGLPSPLVITDFAGVGNFWGKDLSVSKTPSGKVMNRKLCIRIFQVLRLPSPLLLPSMDEGALEGLPSCSHRDGLYLKKMFWSLVVVLLRWSRIALVSSMLSLFISTQRIARGMLKHFCVHGDSLRRKRTMFSLLATSIVWISTLRNCGINS